MVEGQDRQLEGQSLPGQEIRVRGKLLTFWGSTSPICELNWFANLPLREEKERRRGGEYMEKKLRPQIQSASRKGFLLL